MLLCSRMFHAQLDPLHLLNHPFYKAWTNGTLSLETLRLYATEYYHHVAMFPRYISQIHTLCDDLPARQILLGNLIEEEQGEKNHPELWLRFLEGVGAMRHQIESGPSLPNTHALVEGYRELTQESYAVGLGALYAYERQTPEISRSKIDGLTHHYGIHDARSLEFFVVHEKADEWHRDEVLGLVERLSPTHQEDALRGAKQGAVLLWKFLDGMLETTNQEDHDLCMGALPTHPVASLVEQRH